MQSGAILNISCYLFVSLADTHALRDHLHARAAPDVEHAAAPRHVRRDDREVGTQAHAPRNPATMRSSSGSSSADSGRLMVRT